MSLKTHGKMGVRRETDETGKANETDESGKSGEAGKADESGTCGMGLVSRMPVGSRRSPHTLMVNFGVAESNALKESPVKTAANCGSQVFKSPFAPTSMPGELS